MVGGAAKKNFEEERYDLAKKKKKNVWIHAASRKKRILLT